MGEKSEKTTVVFFALRVAALRLAIASRVKFNVYSKLRRAPLPLFAMLKGRAEGHAPRGTKKKQRRPTNLGFNFAKRGGAEGLDLRLQVR